jgi:hypothetical protein
VRTPLQTLPFSNALEHYIELKLYTRVRDVAKVINTAVVHDVHVIVVTPVAWPRLHDDEGIATVLEVRPAFDNLRMAHVEVVFTAEVRVEAVIGDSPTSSVSRLLRALFLRIPALLPVLFLLFLLSFFLFLLLLLILFFRLLGLLFCFRLLRLWLLLRRFRFFLLVRTRLLVRRLRRLSLLLRFPLVLWFGILGFTRLLLLGLIFLLILCIRRCRESEGQQERQQQS